MDFIGTCTTAAANGDLSKCTPIGLGIVDWITIGGAAIGIIVAVFAVGKWIASHFRQRNIRTFKQLCHAIKPFMDDNSRIFRKFGPNSGAKNATEELRFDLSIWSNLLPKIDKNNTEISCLIRSYQDLIPDRHSADFEQWLAHIDAFHAHVGDAAVSYTEFQFPITVVDIVNGK